MGYLREQNNLRHSPFPQSKVESLLQVSCTATQHCLEGVVGGGGSFIIPFWSRQNVTKALIL